MNKHVNLCARVGFWMIYDDFFYIVMEDLIMGGEGFFSFIFFNVYLVQLKVGMEILCCISLFLENT